MAAPGGRRTIAATLGGAIAGVALGLLSTGFGAAPAAAQTITLPQAPAATEPVQSFTEAEWRALVSGKTLYYDTPWGFMGREYYVPNSNRAVFVYYDGRCYDGTWSQDAGLFCFLYDGRHCFEHLREGARIFVRELDGDEQDVVRITDEVLSCEPQLLSQAIGPLGPSGASDAGSN